MRGRLNRRLLAWFLLFSIVPLIATNAFGYRRSHAIIRRQVQRSLAAMATVQAEHVADRVDRHLLVLQALVAGNQFLRAGALHARGMPAGEMGDVATPRAMADLLRSKRRDAPAFTTLYLYTPEGRVLASSGDSADLAPVIPANSDAPTIEVVPAADRTEPEFRLVAPLASAHGGVVAYLAGTVRVSGFRDFLQMAAPLAGHVEATIVDAAGRPIFSTDPDEVSNYASPLHHPLLYPATAAASEYVDARGIEELGTVTDVPGFPWRLIVEVPAAEAFGELRALGGLSVVLEIALGLALVATAWIVAAEIVAPLGRLVDASRRIGGGELGVRVPATDRDEIGELSRAFNDMTVALATTTARVDELHKREIERASQLATVGELASGIAHEIKNPLVGVSNGLDLVRRRIGDDPDLRPIGDEMARQLARIQQAMQELLTFARPAQPALGPVSAAWLVERAIRLVHPTAERGGVTIEVEVDPFAPPFMADEDMLHQALVNVIMNAVQATQAGGHVIVRAGYDSDGVSIEVADTGAGIPADQAEAVFKPFFTTRHTGTGLGLPITREILQRHGGTVTLESEVGVGTRVVLHLPETSAPCGAACATPEEAVRT